MWLAIFIIITLCLFLLPLVPSLMELRFATDTQPLQVIQEYDTEVTHFAVGFTAWLRKNFSEFFIAADHKSTIVTSGGTLQDNSTFQIIGSNDTASFSRKEIYHATTHKLIISAAPLRLTKKMFFEREIYSAGEIETTGYSQFRALLAEGDIVLGEGSTVLRWAHSHASLHAAGKCSLFGRASADEAITLAEHCRFERLNAATILFGPLPPPARKNTAVIALKELPHVKDRYLRRWLIEGDIDIPDRRSFDGDLVATGNIRVGTGAHITGSLKSNGDMYLATGVRIDGSIVSAGNMHMAPGCFVTGPVVAEDTILIEENSIIGSETLPTTITAPKIFITCGAMAHGTIWADERALVLPAPGSSA